MSGSGSYLSQLGAPVRSTPSSSALVASELASSPLVLPSCSAAPPSSSSLGVGPHATTKSARGANHRMMREYVVSCAHRVGVVAMHRAFLGNEFRALACASALWVGACG